MFSGHYDVNDCVFSLPVRFVDGSYSVVDTDLDEYTKNEIKRIELYLKRVRFVSINGEAAYLSPACGHQLPHCKLHFWF